MIRNLLIGYGKYTNTSMPKILDIKEKLYKVVFDAGFKDD